MSEQGYVYDYEYRPTQYVTDIVRDWVAEGHPEEDVRFKFKCEVCPGCEGKGTTWHGWHRSEACVYTGDEWRDLDQEDRDSYMNGAYDGPCPTCDGKRVIDVFDEDYTSDSVLNDYRHYLEQKWEGDAIQAAELRAGA